MLSIIAAHHGWHADLPSRARERTGQEFILFTNKEELTYDRVAEINPRYIFFPHWSYRIPSQIFDNFESVIFHETDVPFGRGGSPLQNLIVRGIYETKISALRCSAEMDAGPVYMKRHLSLHGSAEEIYMRASRTIEDMIAEIVQSNPIPVPQEGDPVCFKRRLPKDGSIENARDLQQVFDFIRMLDAKDYPNAFIETEKFVFEFTRASLRIDCVVADVVIKRRQG